MKKTPIIFCPAMVEGYFAGHKSQTRRLVSPQPIPDRFINGKLEWNPKRFHYTEANRAWNPISNAFQDFLDDGHCPYGQPGDHLWGRETWRTRLEWDRIKPSELPISPDEIADPEWVQRLYITYATADQGSEKLHGKIRPSIFMCEWMSRIDLEIKSIRVERLQDISEEDAKAEGCKPEFPPGLGPAKYKLGYASLWESIHGKGSWAKNPWVWVIEFPKYRS